jgi:integrase
MSRRPNPIPAYRLHRRTGRAIVTVREESGRRRDVLLPGDFDSAESRQEYERLMALLRTNKGTLPAQISDDLTINELILKYMDYAAVYYVRPGSDATTDEIYCLSAAFRPVKRLFGETPVCDFDSIKLETVQQAMSTGSWLTDEERELRMKKGKPIDLARTTVNRNVHRIKRLFRWGAARKLVPTANLATIQAVASLKAGRCKARETQVVTPIDPGIVDNTLPHLPAVIRDMVTLLLLTGARVDELCQLRGRSLDRSGPIWLYTVERHKGLHRGLTRTIAFGPKAQLILGRYLKANPDACLFSPPEAQAQRLAERRKCRTTKLWPSHFLHVAKKRKANPRRKAGHSFDPDRINRAIRRLHCR